MLKRNHCLRILSISLIIVGISIECGYSQNGSSPLPSLYKQHKYNQVLQAFSTKEKAALSSQDYYHYGMSQIAFSNYAKAEEAFKFGIEADASDPLNYVGLARIHGISKDTVKVMSLLNHALINQESLTGSLAAAHMYLGMEMLQEADALINKMRTQEPNNPEVYLLWGDYFVKNGVNVFGIRQYLQALNKDSNFLPAYTKLIRLQFQENNPKQAKSYFEKVQSLDNSPSSAILAMADGFAALDSLDQAESYYNSYLEATDYDPFAQIKYISFLIQSEKAEEALEVLNGLESKADLQAAATSFAKLRMQAGQGEKAYEIIHPFIKNTPEKYLSTDDLLTYARILFEMDNIGSASYYFSRALSKSGDLNGIRKEFTALRKQNPSGEGLQGALEIESEYWRQFLESGSSFTINDHIDYGSYLRAEQKFDESVAEFEKILKIKKTHLKAHIMIFKTRQAQEEADLDHFKGYANTAANNLIELIVELPEKKQTAYIQKLLIEAYTYLGNFHLSSGSNDAGGCDKVGEYVSKIIGIDPKNESAKTLENGCAGKTK